MQFLTIVALSAAIFGTYKYLHLYNDANQYPPTSNPRFPLVSPADCMHIRDGTRCVKIDKAPSITEYTKTGHRMMKRPDYFIAHCENGQNVVMNCNPMKGEILNPGATTL